MRKKWRSILLSSLAMIGCSTAALADIAPVTAAQCTDMKVNAMISESTPVQCHRLRRVVFRFIDFDGHSQAGEMVVLDAVAPRVRVIFETLFEHHFPLKAARSLELYRGSDQASMEDNNSSAFNARPITGGSQWSTHAYGVAIDINPRQNPYLAVAENNTLAVLPTSVAKGVLNRLNLRPGKQFRGGLAEDIVDIFAINGFLTWGGYWDFPIDYQHFEVGTRAFADKLASMSDEDGQRLFEQRTLVYVDCIKASRLASPGAARAACVEQTLRFDDAPADAKNVQ